MSEETTDFATLVIIVNPTDEVSVEHDECSWPQVFPKFICGDKVALSVVNRKLSETRVLVAENVSSVVGLDCGRISGV